QLQLSDDGTIDLLYGDVDVITPTTALTIGFESPDGSDAFTFAHRDLPSLSHTAWRFRPVATAAAAGVVRNANDGLLLAGATVTADPGGRSTITDQDGRYRLALLPGTYALSASAPSSGTAAAPVTASGDATSPVPDLVLPAPDARVLLEPPGDGIDLSVSAGGRRVAGFTLANDGDRPLEWAIH